MKIRINLLKPKIKMITLKELTIVQIKDESVYPWEYRLLTRYHKGRKESAGWLHAFFERLWNHKWE